MTVFIFKFMYSNVMNNSKRWGWGLNIDDQFSMRETRSHTYMSFNDILLE